jgi:predicted RNA methylase
MCGPLTKLRSPFLTMVTLPKLLAKSQSSNGAIYQNRLLEDADKAQFILGQQLKYLRRLLKKVQPNPHRTSDWAEYLGPQQHFTDKYLRTKHDFVAAALKEFAPRTVLDVGCNTGYFSRIAAQSGAAVMAIDFDPTAVGRVWRMATEEKLNVLPLVQDISRPSPGVGWRNSECAPFLARVKGKMDAVIMLAVIHHLLVTERIPLDEILNLIAETTNDVLVLEFVPTDDPMFKQIARGRDHLFEYLTQSVFEEACRKHFQILRSEKLADSNRRLYLLKK